MLYLLDSSKRVVLAKAENFTSLIQSQNVYYLKKEISEDKKTITVELVPFDKYLSYSPRLIKSYSMDFYPQDKDVTIFLDFFKANPRLFPLVKTVSY